MGPYLLTHAALVGFFAFAAIYHLILWWSSRNEVLLAVFSLDCAFRAAFSGVLVAIAAAVTPEEAHAALRVRVALGMLVMTTSLWTVSLVSGIRPRWVIRSVTIVFLTLCFIQTFVMPLNATVLSVDQAVLPWGEIISNPQLAPPGWWFGPLYACVIAVELFGLYCGGRLWRRDRVAGGLILFVGTLMLLIHVLFILKGVGVLNIPFFGIVPHVAWVGVIALLIARAHRQTREQLATSEATRVALETQLIQAQKMEAIGQLAGGIAHDFNNLLTVINGCSELLQMMTPPDDERVEMLQGISDAGQRAAALTRQLLSFSRQQVVAPRLVDLNLVVRESATLLRRLIGEDVLLVTLPGDQATRIEADPAQIGQVIMNLAVNARDAMPTGGTLTIEITTAAIDETSARSLPGARPGRFALLTVTDTGCGMTRDVLSRIFEPFYTTKPPGKGTGIGLATVRTIVDECGGFVVAESQPGKGSTFKVYFPVVDATFRLPPTAVCDADSPRGSETILLAEDDDRVRAMTRQSLQQSGYTVVEARDGKEALRLSAQHSGTIDLLVTDVVMPELGGRELVEQITLVRPDLKVLYLSGYTSDGIVRHGVLQAEVAFLQKPFTPTELAKKVREVLG